MDTIKNTLSSVLPASPAGQAAASHSHSHNHAHGHSLNPAEEEAFWEKMAPRYDSAPVSIAGAKINSAALLATLEENGFSKEETQSWEALEVGGGGGLILPYLLPSFAHVRLTDPSPAMLSLVPAKNFPADQVSYSRFTITSAASSEEFFASPAHAPTPDDKQRMVPPPKRPSAGGYDLLYGTMMLHHVEGLEGFLEGCLGMLRKGGVMIFTDLAKQGGEEFTSAQGHDHSNAHSHDHTHHHNHAHAHGQTTLMAESAVSRPAEQKHAPGFDPVALTAQLTRLGFTDVRCVVRGMIPMPKDLESGECGEEVPLLVIFARKA